MKILILGGGSGDVGRDVARIIINHNSSIDQVTVTARNMDTANEFIKKLSDRRAAAVRLDVTDKNRMIDLMRKHDLIINVIGPFNTFGIPIMRAAIEAKINYIDICDDINPTLEALLLDKDAKKTGIFLLLSMGWFPGTSNIRAKQLADQMDKVDEIVTAWVAGKKAAEEKPSSGIAGTEHYIKALTGKITTFREGKIVKIPAYQKGQELQFPKPLGPYICYQLEHPEPITLPKYIPGVKTASNLGSLYPFNRNKSIRRITRAIDFKILPRSFVSKFLSMQAQSKKKISYPVMNGSYIACIGIKDGKKGQLRYSSTNTSVTTAEATSQPLACAVLHTISTDKIKPGVHLPETSINIKDLIKIGRKLKLPFFTNAIEETSWSEEVNSILQ